MWSWTERIVVEVFVAEHELCLTVGRTDWRKWSRRRQLCEKPRKCCPLTTAGYASWHTTGGDYRIAMDTVALPSEQSWPCIRRFFTCLVPRKVACRRGWRTEERNASVDAREGKQLYQAGMRAPFQGLRRLFRRWRLYSLQQYCSKGVWNFDTLTLLIVATSVRVLHV